MNSDAQIKKSFTGIWKSLKKFAKENCEIGKTYTIYSSREALSCSSMNWQLAINEHVVYIVAYVTLTKEFIGTKCMIGFKVYAYDRYNFTKNKKFHGIPQNWFGYLATAGLAKNFSTIGFAKGVIII